MQDKLEESAALHSIVKKTLFNPESWRATIEFINHLILFNNLLITVLAEKEGGKSSFIQLLLDKLDPQIKTCAIEVAPHCNPYNLIADMAEKLQLKKESADPWGVLELVKLINAGDAPVLLVMDNAQYLPVILVKEILDSIQSQKPTARFHVCLVSDYSVVTTYNQLAKEVFANSIHTIELGTLNELELKTYVTQKIAGNKLAVKFLAEEQLNQLYKMTGGCLSKINIWLDIVKKESAATSSQPSKKIISKNFCLLFLGIFMLSGLSSVLLNTQTRALLVDYVNGFFEKNNKTLVADIPLKSHIPWLEEQAVHQLVYNELPKKSVLVSLDEQSVSDTLQGVVDQVFVIPKIDVNQVAQLSTEANSQINEIVQHNNAQAISEEAEALAYTIQLVASHEMSDIERFAREYKQQGQYTIRQVIRDDDSWYILTTGEFHNAGQANDALQKLSTELLKYKPWVRVTSNLKKVG